MPTNTFAVQQTGFVECFCIGTCNKVVRMPLFENGCVKCPNCKCGFKPKPQQEISAPSPKLILAPSVWQNAE